jgi:hypothetical protein
VLHAGPLYVPGTTTHSLEVHHVGVDTDEADHYSKRGSGSPVYGIAPTDRLTVYAVLLGVWVVDARCVRSPLCGPFEDALPCLLGEVDSERVHSVQIHFGRRHLRW